MSKGITIDLIVDPKGAIQGLDTVEKKSSHLGSVLGGLGNVAVAGVAALGTAALGATVGLVAATKGAGAYAESVQNLSAKTHLSTDAVQELQYASKVTGVDFETITLSLTKLTKSLGQAEHGNKQTAAAFSELGVSTTDANGNLRDSTAVYADVISALGQVSNPTERDVLAMQLLGKSATDLNPLIDGSAGSISDLAAQAHSAGAVLSGDMLTGLGNVDDAFDKLGLGVDAAKNALGLTLMPLIQELGDQGSGLLGDFTNAVLDANGNIGKAAPEIGAVFGKAVSFILGEVPKFLEVGTSIISSIITGIAKQAPTLITAAVPVLVGFVTTLLGQLPMLLGAGAKVLIALVKGIAAALPTLIPAAIEAVIGLVDALITNLPLLLDAGLQLLTGLAQGIIAALPTLIAALPRIIVGLVTFLINAIPQLIQAGVSLLTALVGALPTIITAIVKALPQIIVGITTALITALPQLISAGIQLFLGLIKALPQIIISLQGAVPQIVIGLVKAFTSPATIKAMGDAGLALIRGLWDGIKGAGDWLWKQISGFFGKQIDAIKNLLGIHSPSTVFAGIGRNMILGLAGGISGAAGLATSAMSGLSDQVTASFAGGISVNARAAVAGGAGVGGGTNVYYVSVPLANSYVGDNDGLARKFKAVLVDGIKNGTITDDWSRR